MACIANERGQALQFRRELGIGIRLAVNDGIPGLKEIQIARLVNRRIRRQDMDRFSLCWEGAAENRLVYEIDAKLGRVLSGRTT